MKKFALLASALLLLVSVSASAVDDSGTGSSALEGQTVSAIKAKWRFWDLFSWLREWRFNM